MTEHLLAPRCGPDLSRLSRPVIAVLAVVGALLLAVPQVGHAANRVVSSSPADGDVVGTSPTEISITFANELGDANTIALECETESVSIPRPEVDDDRTTLTVQITEPLTRGTCVAGWRVSNTDGEPDGSGNITFVVQSDTATTVEPDTTDPESTDPASTDSVVDGTGVDDTTSGEGDEETNDGSSPDDDVIPLEQVDSNGGPLWLGTLLSDFGLAALFGGLVVIAAAWPEGVEYLIGVRFFRGAWFVAFVGVILYVAAASAAVNEDSLGSGFNPVSWLDLWDAGWPGRALLARLLLVVISVWVAIRPDRVIDPAAQTAALAIPALAVATIGLSRTSGDLAALGITMGVLHALAMAIWVGGAVLVGRVVLAGPGEEDLVHAVRGFGRLSNAAIGVTLVTGIVQMVRLVGGDLFSSSYGRAVLFKVFVVAAMLFVAISARQFVSTRLARVNELSVPLAHRLRRAFGVEALFGVAVLGLSGWLLALDPPTIDNAPRIDYAIQNRFMIEEADFDVTVKLTNGTVGRAGMEVAVDAPEDGLSDLRVILTAPENDENVGSITQPVPLTGQGVAVRLEENGLPLNAAGEWTMEVRAVTEGGAVRGNPWAFELTNEDGSAPTTEITIPPASTVLVTTVPEG